VATARKIMQMHRAERSLKTYLKEIANYPLLSSEEEIAYSKKIRDGDQQALDKLIKSNLRFVVSISKNYQNQGLPLEDLINAGNLGLIKAAGRFDETRGFKFISYAVWWIRQSILQALAEQSRIVRLPLNRIGLLYKIEKVFSRLEQNFQHEPSSSDIATNLKLKPYEVTEVLNFTTSHLSLDAPFISDEENSLLDLIENKNSTSPDDRLLTESLLKEISNAFTCLTGRERLIIQKYFGIENDTPQTLEEIGADLDLTRERIRQIKEKALKKLRHHNRSELLRKYLG